MTETYVPPRAVAANEAIDEPLTPEGRAAMIDAAAEKLGELLAVLGIDQEGDPNSRGTARRVAKMFVNETMRGRYQTPPDLTDFENTKAYEGIIMRGPIDVRSTCAHHLMPIAGEAYVGILPAADGKVLGLSKYDRVVDHFSSRPQTQEELTQQIGLYLWEETKPRGIAVRINASHGCCTHRGVRASRGRMVTTTYFGGFLESGRKDEFLRECTALELTSR